MRGTEAWHDVSPAVLPSASVSQLRGGRVTSLSLPHLEADVAVVVGVHRTDGVGRALGVGRRTAGRLAPLRR